MNKESGEIAQWFRALAPLAGDLSLILSTHTVVAQSHP